MSTTLHFVTMEIPKAKIEHAIRSGAPLEGKMAGGEVQEFEFRTPKGRPVAGQGIRISRCRSFRADPPPGLPGARFDSLHHAVSDAQGVARIRRLPPGRYALRGGTTGPYAVVSGPGGRSRTVAVPGPRQVFIVRTVLAGGVKVRGDRIVTGRVGFDGVDFRNPLRQLDSIRASLRKRWDTDFAHAGIEGRGAARMRWALLLERTGWQTGASTLVPLNNHPGPTELDIPASRTSVPSGVALLEWNGDGPAPLVHLERPDAPSLDPKQPHQKTRVTIELTPGTPRRLPVGEYRFDMRYPQVRKLFEFRASRISIAADTTTRLRLDRPVMARTILATLRSPGGEPIERPDSVVVEQNGAVVWNSFESHAENLCVVAPMGRCTLRVKALGYRDLVQEFRVTKTGPRVLDYRLEFDESSGR